MSFERLSFIFMDRDGVINKDPGGWTRHNYVADAGDFHFLPGALEALRLLNENGVRVVVVSNQAGVGKGYFSKEMLDKVNSAMLKAITKSGGSVEDVYYCIHRDEDNCFCRKPKTGMFERAAKKYGIDLSRTCIIGDAGVDVMAGRSLGMKTIFVKSGKTSMDEMRKLDVKPDYIFNDLLEAVKWLVARQKRKSERALRRKEEDER